MTLKPDYRLSAVLLLLAMSLVFWQIWIGIPLAVFALFLGIQTALIRLTFTETTLEVYRGATVIRCFPYAEWLHWDIYVQNLPVLFYFREVKSIHFLPMLFHPGELRQCLERYVTSMSSEKLSDTYSRGDEAASTPSLNGQSSSLN